ncbi:hypothetical protein BGX23_004252, partial [Mortierella sp. AD031]
TNDNLPVDRLAAIFQMTHRVRRLSVESQIPDYYSLFEAIRRMRELEAIHLDLPNSFYFFLDLESFIREFSQLKELTLHGKWYAAFEDPQENAQDNGEEWSIQRLTISRADMGIFPRGSTTQEMAGLEDALQIMTSLERLFSFQVKWAEQAELINTGRRQPPVVEVAGVEVHDETLTKEYALPSLKELECTVVRLTPDEQDRFVRRLLQQHPLLERLILPESVVVPVEAVIAIEWRCLQLTELRLTISDPEDPDQATAVWRSFYSQIGRLRDLRTLHIVCLQFNKSEDAGIGEMRGAVNLRNLTFSNIEGEWSQGDIRRLVTATPALEYLNLFPISLANWVQALRWLHGLGKAHILASDHA